VSKFVREGLNALARLAPVLVFYLVYTIVRWLLADRGPTFGPDDALRVLRLERFLDLDWELSIQQFGLRHAWIPKVANWYYVVGFLPVLVISSLLAAWRAPETFLRWRRIFAISLFLALLGFALFPVSPPRLLPSDGYIDTLLAYGPHYYGNANGKSIFNGNGRLPTLVNLYAAMPSMHVAWSTVAGIFLTVVMRRRWIWIFAVLHPILMAFTVIVTANHFVLDVVAGMGVLGVSIAADHLLTRRNPHRAALLYHAEHEHPRRLPAELDMAYSD
jgi:hypothetical protein